MIGKSSGRRMALICGVAGLLLFAQRSGIGERAPVVDSSQSYDHFFYLRHNEKNGGAITDSLVMASVKADGIQQKDIYTKSNLHVGWRPITVVGGKVFGLKIGDLIAIDIATGKAELLHQYIKAFAYQKGRLYVVLPTDGQLRAYDLASGTQHDITKLPNISPIRSHVPMSVSPNGRKLAIFIGEGENFPPQSFRLVVVDLQTGRRRNVTDGVRSGAFLTGGGSWSSGPNFVWLDDQNILFMHDVVPKDADGAPVNVFGPSQDVALSRVNVGSDIVSRVAQLPRMKSRRIGQPFFAARRQDGAPRIVMGELGHYRVDVKGRRIVEDNSVGRFQWIRGNLPEELLLDGKPLAKATGHRQLAARVQFYGLSVSPDGNRVVWKNEWQGTKTALRFCDADQRQPIVVARGWFPREWHAGDYLPLAMWAKSSDLTKSTKRAIPPMGWRPMVTRPWPLPRKPVEPDERPNVADLITMEIKTEKPKFKLHEPARVMVTLTNKTDRDFEFKRPGVYTRTFSLGMEYPHGGTSLDEFDEGWKEGRIVIKARDSLTFARTIEPHDLGEHVLDGEFRQSSKSWRGSVKAKTIKFVVEKSDDYEQLLKAKFDRFWQACNQEFDSDPATCAYHRMFDLGEDAVPLMIAELEKSDQPAFRRRMGYALAVLADSRALPYLTKLLKGDMQDDVPLVVETLQNMHRRKVEPDAAVDLLIVALKHDNVFLRRRSAKALRRIGHSRVKNAFAIAVKDEDFETATVAARYLAAYERVPLAEWLLRCATKRTHARYIAARSIVAQLEKTWNTNKGKFPDELWDEVQDSPQKFAAFMQTINAWQEWAAENTRFSTSFFDEDRENWPQEVTANPSEQGSLEFQPIDADGKPFIKQHVVVSRASIGFAKDFPFKSYSLDRGGWLKIKNVKPGEHHFVVRQQWPNATFLELAVPMAGLRATKFLRQMPPGYEEGRHPDLEVKAELRRSVGDDIIYVVITNNSNRPYDLHETDLCLTSPDYRILPPKSQQRVGWSVLPRGRGKLTLSINWRRFVQNGLWVSRGGEDIDEPWPVEKPPAGRSNFRVHVGITGGTPVALTKPDLVLAEVARKKKLKAEVELDKEQCLLGENVLLHYKLTNTADQPVKIELGGDNRGSPRQLRFKVIAFDEKGKAVEDPHPNPMNMGGLGSEPEIKAGETFWVSVPLMKYCNIKQPGVYRVRVYHDLGWDGGWTTTGPAPPLEKNEFPKDGHLAPIAETEIKFVLPDMQQAKELIERTLKLSSDRVAWRERSEEWQDFTALRHPVYLTFLHALVDRGDKEAKHALEAIGEMESPTATKVLIELLGHKSTTVSSTATHMLRMRMPHPEIARRKTWNGAWQRTERLVSNAWRDRFRPDVVQHGWKLLSSKDRQDRIDGAWILMCLGDKNDLPRFLKVMDKLMVEAATDSQEQRAYPRPITVTAPLIDAAYAMTERGAAVPASPNTAAELALFARTIGKRKEFRPQRWQTTTVKAMSHRIPFVRAVAVENLPTPVPESVYDALLERLSDDFPPVAAAALYKAAATKSPRFHEAAVKVQRATTDEWIKRAAEWTARQCVPR